MLRLQLKSKAMHLKVPKIDYKSKKYQRKVGIGIKV